MLVLALVSAVVAFVVVGLGARRHAKRAARDRQRARAWWAFFEAPVAPPDGTTGTTYLLDPPPGPAGEVTVCEAGLTLVLALYPGQPAWVPWEAVRSLDHTDRSGVRVYLCGGLNVHVSALAGRAIWESQRNHVQSAAAVTA